MPSGLQGEFVGIRYSYFSGFTRSEEAERCSCKFDARRRRFNAHIFVPFTRIKGWKTLMPVRYIDLD
jgi:hypothetical protein